MDNLSVVSEFGIFLQSPNIHTVNNQEYIVHDVGNSILLIGVEDYEFVSQFGKIEFDANNILSVNSMQLSLIGNSFLSSITTNTLENNFLSNGNHMIEGEYSGIVVLDEDSGISGNGLIENLVIGGDNSTISPDLVPFVPSDILQIQNFTSSFDSELNIRITSTSYSRLIIEPNDNIDGRIFINIDYSGPPIIPGSIYYPVYSMNEDLESKQLFYIRESDRELLVSNCSIVSNIDNESFRVFFDSSIDFGNSALKLQQNFPPTIQNLTCSTICSRNIDCICCVDFVSSILDPDLSDCPETFTLVDNQNGLFVDPDNSAMVCYTEISIQESIQESIEYQIEDTGGDLSNLAYINFSFIVPTNSPTPSTSPTTSITPTSSNTPSISKTNTESPNPTISNTPSSSITNSITPKESLILVIPTLEPVISVKPSALINQIPSKSASSSSQKMPTSSNDDCIYDNCEIGYGEVDIDVNENSDNNIEVNLISIEGNIIGELIIPNSIVNGGTLSYSFISSDSYESNDITIGKTIIDITITDEFGLPVFNFDESITICLEEDDDNIKVSITITH